MRASRRISAYCFFPANYMIAVVAMILPGPHRLRNYGFALDVFLTNKCPAGPMRAPMASASWIMEGTIDAIARELGLDPLEVRRVNTITDADLPCATATDELYVDVTPAATLERATQAIDYGAFRTRQAQAAGEHLGLGICTVVEPTTMASGQGYETTLAQCAGEALGCRIEDVSVQLGPYRHRAPWHGKPRQPRPA